MPPLPPQTGARHPFPKSLALQCHVQLLVAAQLLPALHHRRPLCRRESTELVCFQRCCPSIAPLICPSVLCPMVSSTANSQFPPRRVVSNFEFSDNCDGAATGRI